MRESMQSLVDFVRQLYASHGRIVRFLVSGGTGATTNFLTLFILTEYAGVWYLLSASIALAVGFTMSFILQKFWTFENSSLARVHIQVPLHVTLGLTNLVLNTIALYILVEWFGLWYMLGQLIAGVFLACLNYYTYRTHIFKPE
ncbi:MAG: GtrA family protein [Parcubacteria group bacterium Gr01-1014_8]|nr:MAG: GtrA family protein [Parcubacteria group bacterium Gr01-1014_8]